MTLGLSPANMRKPIGSTAAVAIGTCISGGLAMIHTLQRARNRPWARKILAFIEPSSIEHDRQLLIFSIYAGTANACWDLFRFMSSAGPPPDVLMLAAYIIPAFVLALAGAAIGGLVARAAKRAVDGVLAFLLAWAIFIVSFYLGLGHLVMLESEHIWKLFIAAATGNAIPAFVFFLIYHIAKNVLLRPKSTETESM